MKMGAVFPQTEIGDDPGAISAFAQAVEDLGFDHLLAYDHVVGASAAGYGKEQLRGPYREQHMFHEPLVLFGFLAGVTRRIGLATGVMVLPQRQTVLVAKQAAEVDVLSKGRLRLGVGTGWNHVEYTALGKSFADRGRYLDEQVALLRKLWTEPLVEFEGEFESVPNAGLNPLPRQRPIPIWFGGMNEKVLKRVARTGDGWLPLFKQFEPGMSRTLSSEMEPKAIIGRMHGYAREAGRDPAAIGIECRISCFRQTEDDWQRNAAIFREAGATHLSLVTMNAGFESVDDHIKALETMRAAARD
jgi:probable F420-dependent oxidoreductase